MACATLKRPLEWSDPSMSPPRNANSDTQLSSDGHYGGHHHHGYVRPAKRRCSTHVSMIAPPSHKDTSPFGDVQPKISADEIAASIREEMIRLYNRKKLHQMPGIGSGSSSGVDALSGHSHATIGNESEPNSCSQDGSSSPIHEIPSQSHCSIGLLSPSRRDVPLFTFRQVSLICDRLIKERETQIRNEYDYVLTTKLAEQYDTFVKFTYDQIQKRFENGTTPSYLS